MKAAARIATRTQNRWIFVGFSLMVSSATTMVMAGWAAMMIPASTEEA